MATQRTSLEPAMKAARWQEIKTAFDSLLELEPSLWSVEVGKIGVHDPELGRALEGLLSAHFNESDEFLEIPAAALAPLGDDPEEDSRLGTHVGPYELIRELGSGGMGEVYLARRVDAEFEQQVAIKLIRSGQDSAAVVRRFRAERQILANLDHPNIAKLLDGGRTAQGQPYFVMEYVAGLPITDYCDRHRLKIRERIELFLQACEGVQHAHQNAIIHRDLKPANILVIEVDGREVPRIIDFGIAKAASLNLTDQTLLTRMGHFIGTPGYMSPEQADPNAKNIDSRTDVYSLGVILYALLTGLQPFETAPGKMPPLDVWLRQLREEEPPRPSRKVTANTGTTTATATMRSTVPSQLVSELRGDLDWIVMKSLERERERRYGTPSELVADLRRYLNHEPVLARPASRAYRAMKFTRRHWVGIAATSVLILTLAAGLAATSYEARIASQQRDAALDAQLHSLTQTAAARLKDGDIPGALGIILEVLARQGGNGSYPADSLGVFEEARAADARLSLLSGHTALVKSAAFSPDGRRIITASYDKTARIWDATTGDQTMVLRHATPVSSAAFSPDGRRIVTSSGDNNARIWDAATGQEILVLRGHARGVTRAVFSPDGKHVVTASLDMTARLWDATTGHEIWALRGHSEQLNSAAFSPDGRRIVTASSDKTARIWDATTGRELSQLTGHTASVAWAEFSHDGRRLVTASSDRTARVWDAATGREVWLLSDHSDQLSTVAFSPDDHRIVTASADATACLWDATTGRRITQLSGHAGFVWSAAFSPDGRYIVTASGDHTARVWDAVEGRQIVLLRGHSDEVYFAAISPDGRRVLTTSFDKTARIWDATTGGQIMVLRYQTWFGSADFSPDGRHIVTSSGDNNAEIWDAATGQEILVLRGHTRSVNHAVFSPDGQRVVTASLDNTARIWDATTGQEIRALKGHTEQINSAVFSPDGQRIVTASYDHSARIWDAATGRQILLLSGHTGIVTYAVFSPDGRRVITSSFDKTVRVWDAVAGREMMLLSGHSDKAQSAVFSADGRHIVTASDDKTARIWDAATGQEIAVLSGHTSLVYFAVFSPDGSRVVTASADKTARLWSGRTPTLAVQILWAKAAQFDPLPSAERLQLGLPALTDARRWALDPSKCDESAAAPYDPDRRAPGVMLDQVVSDIAVGACAIDKRGSQDNARSVYQHGRALEAGGNLGGARNDFEAAVTQGYRSAQVDLALVLSQTSGGMLDVPRALSLLKGAWSEGVPIAAFELGWLYEHGVRRPDHENEYVLAPDNTQAWVWYRKGADAAEPNALARFAEAEDGSASSEESATRKNAHLLESFEYYAAAAERARREDWPDEAWMNWRYRRASLARLLVARDGTMQQVADAYAAVLARTQR